LDNCSNGEQNKYVGIGATVFFTAIMALVAASYALYTVFDSYFAAIFFGIIWGLLIFNLDRFIVSTIRKKENLGDEFIQASPRIVLAVIIAIVISKPLELKIFEKEIDRVLLEQKNDFTSANKEQIGTQYTPLIGSIDKEIESLKQEVTTTETEVNTLYETYIAEAEGTKGTKRTGKGPVYKEKREKHDAAQAELVTLKQVNVDKIKNLEAQKEELETSYNDAVENSQPIIDNFDGLMARITALNELPWLPSFFIFLLFLAIETSPILAKLMSPKGEYDYKLQDLEGEVKSLVAQKEGQRKTMLKIDFEINDRVYQDLVEEEGLYAHKKKITRDIMKQQQDAFYKNQAGVL